MFSLRRFSSSLPFSKVPELLGSVVVKEKKPRAFDDYTWSIWARGMAGRGQHDEALRMLENAIVERKAKSPTVLFNTAIDMCGHAGRFTKAWSLFNDMKKRGVRPNERTISSMLNALAESVASRPDAERRATKEAVWEKALSLYKEARERKLGTGAFHLNGLLKVASRLQHIEGIRELFPMDAIPPEADEISFTIVWNALGHSTSPSFTEALELLEKYKLRNPGVPISFVAYQAVLFVLKGEVFQISDRRALTPEWRTETAQKIERCLEDCLRHNALPLPVAITTMVLEIYTRTHSWQHAVDFADRYLKPVIDKVKHVKNLKGTMEGYAMTLILKCLANTAPAFEAGHRTFAFFEELLNKGHRPSVHDINALLMACNRARLPGRADAFFRAHFRKRNAHLTPDLYSMLHLSETLLADSRIAEYDEHFAWLMATYPKVYEECKAHPRIQESFKRHTRQGK